MVSLSSGYLNYEESVVLVAVQLINKINFKWKSCLSNLFELVVRDNNVSF